LNVSGLSAEEWNYIRGLFLADGYSYIGKRGERRVTFSLNKVEGELALRLVELLARAGLNPYKWINPRRNVITVLVNSKALVSFLPNKKILGSDDVAERESLFEENKLFTAKEGVPFLAGLLDGDGRCRVHIRRTKGYIRAVTSSWSFAQKSYPFLADYVRTFVESLAQGGTHAGVYNDDGTIDVYIPISSREALLEAGIAKYSWRVARCLMEVAEAKSKRLKYYTMSQVAQLLNVHPSTVKNWLKAGAMRYVREKSRKVVFDRGRRKREASLWYCTPVEEVEKFRKKLQQGEEETKRVEESGEVVKLVEVAKMLGISLDTLHGWCQCGKLRARLVHRLRTQGGNRYLVVPREEVERLRKQVEKKVI
jgi:excisionase family DNA binding protein